MLKATETNVPAWFVVFVVLPLVIYFLLGKCGESAKRKSRSSLIDEGAVEDALQVDGMAVQNVMPVVHLPNDGIRRCAKCFDPAKTRCSQCKSVWYCSGRCQIAHWRHVHKLECLQVGRDCRTSSLTPILNEASFGRLSYGETEEQNSFKHNEQTSIDNAPSDDAIFPSTNMTSAVTVGTTLSSRKSVANQRLMNGLIKGNRNLSGTTADAALNTSKGASGIGLIHPAFSQLSGNTYLAEHQADSPSASYNQNSNSRSSLHESPGIDRDHLNLSDGGNHSSVSAASIGNANARSIQMDTSQEKYLSRIPSNYETKDLNCSFERASAKKSNKSRNILNTQGTELHKSLRSRVPGESQSSDKNLNIKTANQSKVAGKKDNIPLQESNRVSSLGVTRGVSMKKLEKTDHQKHAVDTVIRHKKLKMIFPYEEFVKYFNFEVFNLTPRGLVNCGNSCYANAVLQCLTCTKPLTIYLLRQTHTRAGCAKDCCLVCELEQLVSMLKDSRGPLSPINVLTYIRSLNSQIGDGSQEDAHEFLRLLVASMQSICLESFGGENVVQPRLQDTTFIQHMFGGYLRSKVTCLRCYHVSERYENMMDLTLEIYGWVESLEDALTQFTSSEDLDGENMYRCPRCAAYVPARKQLNIQEAPNILTIVLKRFKEGSYGKITKCISFPEMLDMVPFMTGTDDIPPLYILYAIVVHLDTSNASFSGHYISYVKDMQGNWLKVDDTEVQPVELSQVMLEGAYILFYTRSHPRPARVNTRATRHRTTTLPKNSLSKTQRSSRQEQTKPNHNYEGPCNGLETQVDRADISRTVQIRENKSKPSSLENYVEFSDVTSSDRSSLFTSSDDSSFTTESTRDSFSTMDHADVVAFRSPHPANSKSHITISGSMFGRSIPQTRFAREEKGFVSVSCVPPHDQTGSYILPSTDVYQWD